ncbi:MAG TPA: cupin domain-containing protein [Myxococcaceae bacterium]|jgi:uncharacterized cupin superfamily protein
MSRPPFVISSAEVKEEEGHYDSPFDGEKLSFGRDLGKAVGSVTVGLVVERIPHGRRTSFTHAHSAEEEIVYVVSGNCSVRIVEPNQRPREIDIAAGDVIAFPANTGIAHTFVNHGTEDCVLICCGERKPGVDRVFYPEDREFDEYVRANRPQRHWSR